QAVPGKRPRLVAPTSEANIRSVQLPGQRGRRRAGRRRRLTRLQRPGGVSGRGTAGGVRDPTHHAVGVLTPVLGPEDVLASVSAL
ncbi:MAG: hypothetical protein M3524_13600, partial [Actinomycetota bacterium]|nr:hypothetical protein [Actinomycetota bacterium]